MQQTSWTEENNSLYRLFTFKDFSEVIPLWQSCH